MGDESDAVDMGGKVVAGFVKIDVDDSDDVVEGSAFGSVVVAIGKGGNAVVVTEVMLSVSGVSKREDVGGQHGEGLLRYSVYPSGRSRHFDLLRTLSCPDKSDIDFKACTYVDLECTRQSLSD